MATLTLNKLTEYQILWIKHNGYQKEFSTAKTVDDLKVMWFRKMKRFFPDGKPTETFKKGARTIDWNLLFRVLTNGSL